VKQSVTKKTYIMTTPLPSFIPQESPQGSFGTIYPSENDPSGFGVAGSQGCSVPQKQINPYTFSTIENPKQPNETTSSLALFTKVILFAFFWSLPFILKPILHIKNYCFLLPNNSQFLNIAIVTTIATVSFIIPIIIMLIIDNNKTTDKIDDEKSFKLKMKQQEQQLKNYKS